VPSSGPKAFNPSRCGDLRISGNQRKVECDGGRGDQAVTAFRNRIEPLGNVDNFGCQFRFMVFAAGKREACPFFKW
jgi:hypothetical protein